MSTALAFKDGMIVSNQSLFTPSGNCALWIFSENSGMPPWIFVSDSNNHVVQVFDAHTGTNLRQIGTGKKGLAAGKLNTPRGLVLRVADIVSGFPTILFVCEFFNHRVQIFDAYLGNHERFIGGKRGSLEASVLNGPTGLALVESPPGGGRPALLYVADFWNSRVAVFDADTGDYSHQIGVGEVGSPWGLILRNTLANTGQSPMLYVADFSNRQVLVFDAGSGDRLGSIGSITECSESENECGGDTPGELTEPAAVALLESLPGSDQPTLLYVADSARNEISVFDADNGQFIRLLGGGAGSAAGQLNQPSGLILHLGSDGNRNFFVTESGNRRVQILTEAAISSSYKRSDDLLTFVDIQDIKINSKKELEERLRIEAEDNARWDEEERVRKDAKERIKKEARRAAKSKAKQEVRRKKLERLEEQATCGLSSAVSYNFFPFVRLPRRVFIIFISLIYFGCIREPGVTLKTLRMDDNDVNRNLKNLLSEHFFFFGAYRRCKLADTTAATRENSLTNLCSLFTDEPLKIAACLFVDASILPVDLIADISYVY